MALTSVPGRQRGRKRWEQCGTSYVGIKNHPKIIRFPIKKYKHYDIKQVVYGK